MPYSGFLCYARFETRFGSVSSRRFDWHSPRVCSSSVAQTPFDHLLTPLPALCVLLVLRAEDAADITASKSARKRNAAAAAAAAPPAKKAKGKHAAAVSSSESEDSDDEDDSGEQDAANDLNAEIAAADAASPPSARSAKGRNVTGRVIKKLGGRR